MNKLKEGARKEIMKFNHEWKKPQEEWFISGKSSQYDKAMRANFSLDPDLFEVTEYKVKLNPTFNEEWDDMAYLIKRDRVDFVKEKVTAMKKKFKGGAKWRPTGETVLHVCA